MPNLPIELWHHVFNFSDEVTSTCLGLTYMTLYLIHKRNHERTAPQFIWLQTGNYYQLLLLYYLLDVWVGQDLLWNEGVRKFTTRKKKMARIRRQLCIDRGAYLFCKLVELYTVYVENRNWRPRTKSLSPRAFLDRRIAGFAQKLEAIEFGCVDVIICDFDIKICYSKPPSLLI